jgi:hypothetical protein
MVSLIPFVFPDRGFFFLVRFQSMAATTSWDALLEFHFFRMFCGLRSPPSLNSTRIMASKTYKIKFQGVICSWQTRRGVSKKPTPEFDAEFFKVMGIQPCDYECRP